jgi:hypothetical protein
MVQVGSSGHSLLEAQYIAGAYDFALFIADGEI